MQLPYPWICITNHSSTRHTNILISTNTYCTTHTERGRKCKNTIIEITHGNGRYNSWYNYYVFRKDANLWLLLFTPYNLYMCYRCIYSHVFYCNDCLVLASSSVKHLPLKVHCAQIFMELIMMDGEHNHSMGSPMDGVPHGSKT